MPTENTLAATVSEAPRTATNVDRGVAAIGALTSVGALFSAAACCILPVALAAIGVGASGLTAFVPFHWPLTIAALVAVAAGWLIYARKRKACASDTACSAAPPTRSTLVLLCLATALVTISACWTFIEAPLMRALGGQ